MKLSVIIVNYNVKYYLEQCLHSLYQALGYIRAEVLVVDNASTDGSNEYFSGKSFPGFTYISNQENVGFSRANNQAIKQCTGEYVLLLNPDTLLPENILKELISFMDEHPEAGAAGVRMYAPDGKFLPESKRGIPSPWSSFGKLMGVLKLFPGSRRFGGYYLSQLHEGSIHEVQVLAGAFMFFRRSVFEKCGLLDEDYFMYGEDIDISCRVLAAGFKNYYLPLPILHYKGESTSKDSAQQIRVFYKAMTIFFRKHEGGYNPVFRFIVKTGITLRMNMALLMLGLKRMHRQLFPIHEQEPCFIVLGSEMSIGYIQAICRRNKLSKQHHYLLADEQLLLEPEASLFLWRNTYTHVIYDTAAFSYSFIIDYLTSNQLNNLRIGVYDADSYTLVTPEKCYI